MPDITIHTIETAPEEVKDVPSNSQRCQWGIHSKLDWSPC